MTMTCTMSFFLQKVTLETTIRLTWFDTRISVNLSKDQDYLMINRNPTLDIWFPDVYLSKVQDLRVPTYVIEPRYLKITKDRRLTYSARVNYDFACPMNFKYYPVICFLSKVLLLLCKACFELQ